MSYTIIEHRAKGTTITRVHGDGRREVLRQPPKPKRQPMVSKSNGIVGGEAAKAKHEKMDAELGVRDCVRYEPIGHGAFVAKYRSVKDYDRWMRARRRVNHDAGHGTPAPGDFGYR